MPVDVIETQLRELAGRLASVPLCVSILGDGAGKFLYIVGNGCAAEVSPEARGWWVEFWNSPEEDVQPVADAMFDSIAGVESALIKHFVA